MLMGGRVEQHAARRGLEAFFVMTVAAGVHQTTAAASWRAATTNRKLAVLGVPLALVVLQLRMATNHYTEERLIEQVHNSFMSRFDIDSDMHMQ